MKNNRRKLHGMFNNAVDLHEILYAAACAVLEYIDQQLNVGTPEQKISMGEKTGEPN